MNLLPLSPALGTGPSLPVAVTAVLIALGAVGLILVAVAFHRQKSAAATSVWSSNKILYTGFVLLFLPILAYVAVWRFEIAIAETCVR